MSLQNSTLAPVQRPADESGALRELYVLTDRLYRSQSVNDIYKAALDALQATLRCQRASILLFDDAGVMRFVAWRGLSDHYRKTLEGHSPWQSGTRDAEPIFVRDIRESDEPAWIRDTIEREGIRGLGFIPLVARGEVIGKFMTYHDAPHDFAERDIGVAVHIARQVGFSIERQRVDAERARSEEALRESEERFRVMCEHAPVMIWMSKPDGSCLYLNRMLREFWNVAEEDLASFSWGTTMHPEDAQRIGATMYDAVQRRVPVSLQGRYRNRQGAYRILHTDARPRTSSSGEFLGLIGVNIDVTDREEAEAALRRSEERLRLATNAAGIFSWESDLVMQRMSWSDNAASLIGCKPEELTADMARSLFFVLEEDQARLLGEFAARYAEQAPSFSMTFRSRGASGELRHWQAEGSIQYDEAGRPLRILGITQDVSERKRVQLELETALASLEVTLDGADAAPWQYHSVTRDVLWSPRGYQQLGYDVGGKLPSLDTFLQHVHPEDRAALVKLRAEEAVAPEGAKFSLELRLLPSDGSTRWIERRSRVGPQDAQGRIIYGVDIDISERKRAEEAVRESEERLRSLTANMPAAMVFQISASVSGERRFTFVASNCKQLNGIEAEEVIRNPGLIYGMILPEHRAVFLEREQAAIAAMAHFDHEVPMRRADGELRWFRISSAPRSGPKGGVLWDGIQVDITERVLAEQAQREAVAERESIAAEREAVLRQLGEGVIVTNAEGRIVYVNQAAAAIHGTAELDVPVAGYSTTYRLFTEEGEPYPAERLPLARAVMNRETVNNERWLIRRNDGAEIAAVGSASPVYRADGSFMGAVLTLRDDTARHIAEQALRINQERLAAAFKIGRIGIYDYNVKEGRAVNWDKLICDIWGIREDEFLSDEIYWSGVYPADIPVIEKAVAAGLDPDGPRRYQSEYRVTSRRDGKMRWVHVDAAVTFEGREPIRILGTVQDITERKQAEEHIRLLMREVNHRSKNLLAVVQAIASQTALRGEPKSFARIFRDRIQGLAASHDLLVKNAWEGADLRELVCSQLSHFEDLIGYRIFLEGAPLKVSPSAAQALGLALHELATNAGKYGSLSVSKGTVTIAWEVTGEGEGRTFTMSWTEAGGPPVKAPERKGFGTLLIADTTASALEGEVKLDHDESGLRWVLTAPFASVVSR